MKLISLNTWGGKLFDNLIEYVKAERDSTDIFCFQEVYSTSSAKKQDAQWGTRMNLYQELSAALPQHQGYFDPSVEGEMLDEKDLLTAYGLATFVRKGISVSGLDSVEVYPFCPKPDGGHHYRRTLQTMFIDDGNIYFIGNVHGLHTGGGKGDLPERIRQSEIIRDRFRQVKAEKILCGDFNLLPTTESIKILTTDFVNLIATHHIATTRSKYYEKPVKFADYCFVSSDVRVKSFSVPYVEASDHLPMVLEI